MSRRFVRRHPELQAENCFRARDRTQCRARRRSTTAPCAAPDRSPSWVSKPRVRSVTSRPRGSSTPPRHVSPARGMIGFSSLSRELARASLHDSASDEALTSVSKPQPSSASRVSIDTDGGERDEMRRSRSISNMVPSSWHEGSQYLK
jgi:hypothetical protein